MGLSEGESHHPYSYRPNMHKHHSQQLSLLNNLCLMAVACCMWKTNVGLQNIVIQQTTLCTEQRSRHRNNDTLWVKKNIYYLISHIFIKYGLLSDQFGQLFHWTQELVCRPTDRTLFSWWYSTNSVTNNISITTKISLGVTLHVYAWNHNVYI